MQTLKEIKQSFTEELYSWANDLDFIPWVLSEMKNDYVKELENANPEWEEENILWEAWYVRWYEVALIWLLNYFKAINIASEWEYYPTYTTDKLEEMINNLLTN